MDMLYEAKVMDVQAVEKPGDGYRYKVHYKGWKNTWDDWVLVDRIRPFDDEHKELAAQLHAQLKHNMARSAKQPKKGLRSGPESARVSEERSGSATVQGGRGGRRTKDWELEQVRRRSFYFVTFNPVLRSIICLNTEESGYGLEVLSHIHSLCSPRHEATQLVISLKHKSVLFFVSCGFIMNLLALADKSRLVRPRSCGHGPLNCRTTF